MGGERGGREEEESKREGKERGKANYTNGVEAYIHFYSKLIRAHSKCPVTPLLRF